MTVLINTALLMARAFVEEELAVREQSLFPDPGDDQPYIDDAKSVLAAIDEALAE